LKLYNYRRFGLDNETTLSFPTENENICSNNIYFNDICSNVSFKRESGRNRLGQKKLVIGLWNLTCKLTLTFLLLELVRIFQTLCSSNLFLRVFLGLLKIVQNFMQTTFQQNSKPITSKYKVNNYPYLKMCIKSI
jgi:hypothetical protein